jgi:type I restriction enzyme, S subunit
MKKKEVEVEVEERELPEGWHVLKIGEAGTVQLGRQRSPKFHSGSSMHPYLRVQNVFDDRIDLDDVMEMDFPGEDAERYKLKPGDILLNEGQSPELLGRPAMYQGELPGACFTNTLIRFQSGSCAHPRYCLQLFRYYMKSGVFRGEGTITTNIAHLGAGRFAALPIPLPPLPEQERIAARLDLLLGKLKTARSRLDALPQIIARFRKSLLAEAVSGRLTEEWREKNIEKIPDEEELFDTLLSLADSEDDLIADSDIVFPICWICIPLKVCLKQVQYGTSKKSLPVGEYPVLRMGNIQNGLITWDDLVFSVDKDDARLLMLNKGDILFNRTNSPALVGKAALFDGSRKAIFAGYLIRLVCNQSVLLPAYLNYYLASPSGREYCWSVKTDGVSQSNINTQSIQKMPCPLPSLLEQAEIVHRVDALFAKADALEAKVEAARALADRLEPSILAKAFRGVLSEQIPEEAAAWERTLAEIEAQTAALAERPGVKRGRVARGGAKSSARGLAPKLGIAAEATKGYAAAAPKKRGRPKKA